MMSAYIKLSTLEYPRHEGDIAIDPAGAQDYALVQWVEPPVFDRATQRCYEIAPIEINGTWTMQWSVRDATPDEIQEANKTPKMPWERF